MKGVTPVGGPGARPGTRWGRRRVDDRFDGRREEVPLPTLFLVDRAREDLPLRPLPQESRRWFPAPDGSGWTRGPGDPGVLDKQWGRHWTRRGETGQNT